ncbi:MAG: UDP-galactopyranose mutase [Lachnospiraceae bacterium]|nr:UDP-galactopyranose mutase [Lachnospiraceae bacterium]
MYDCIIIGSGFAGAVAADLLAREKGKKVLVLERRSHVGGNCYDVEDDYGILIHQYGPHIFHTNLQKVYEYLSQYTEWYDYSHEVVGYINGTYMPIPFNLNTLKQVYGEEKAARLESKLIASYGEGSRVPILQLRQSEDEEIRDIAEFVYQNVFLKYTMKQWGQKPEEIDPAVTGRVPVLISHDNRYFQDQYQGMPLNGYTPMFEKMLKHENIEVRLNTDALSVLEFADGKILFEGRVFSGIVVFTGAIDELFGCRYGKLPYRSLHFEFEHYEKEDFQPRAVVNYTVSEAFTRITEFKKLTGQHTAGTTIMKEYPMAYTGEDGQIPYYAIMNEENNRLYEKYKKLAEQYPNMYLIGRLAEYKYYNIDAIVARAMETVESM